MEDKPGAQEVDRIQVWGEREEPKPKPHPILVGALALLALVVVAGLLYNSFRSRGGCSPSRTFGVADLPQYLADCDRTVAWFIDVASVSGNTLAITVNSGWYGFSAEQKARFVAELLPAVFILARQADGVASPGNVVVSLFDDARRLVGQYWGDTGRYVVYR